MRTILTLFFCACTFVAFGQFDEGDCARKLFISCMANYESTIDLQHPQIPLAVGFTHSSIRHVSLYGGIVLVEDPKYAKANLGWSRIEILPIASFMYKFPRYIERKWIHTLTGTVGLGNYQKLQYGLYYYPDPTYYKTKNSRMGILGVVASVNNRSTFTLGASFIGLF